MIHKILLKYKRPILKNIKIPLDKLLTVLNVDYIVASNQEIYDELLGSGIKQPQLIKNGDDEINTTNSFCYVNDITANTIYYKCLPDDPDIETIEWNPNAYIITPRTNTKKLKKIIFDHLNDFSLMLHQSWTSFLRYKEIEKIKEYIDKYLLGSEIKILEVGAGNGYMASKLSELSKENKQIFATDIAPRYPSFYPVDISSPEKQPYDNNQFDLIYSSNVLEHVQDINDFFKDLERILKKDGVMIHTMPSNYMAISTWIMSPLAYFRNIALYFYRHRSKYKKLSFYWYIDKAYNFIKVINPLKVIIPTNHGEYSGIETIYKWTKTSWAEYIYSQTNYKVVETTDLKLAASMHKMFPHKFMYIRKLLGKIGFSTVNIFILKHK